MSLEEAAVRKTIQLARIRVSEEDIPKLHKELKGIVDWVEELSAVNTENVEPLRNVVDIALKRRDDLVNDGNNPQKVLSNAPETTQGFYVVPKIINSESDGK